MECCCGNLVGLEDIYFIWEWGGEGREAEAEKVDIMY